MQIQYRIYMSAIILLLLASITVALIFLLAFIWGVKNGQFSDSFSPPLRILFDDGAKPEESATSPNQENTTSANNTQKPALHTVCKLKNSITTTKP
jgi:cbb3-type cytochrome oxidase maturation protein